MVKKLVYLLIFALTFQIGWGVASECCMHETGKAAHHFGHHDHKHQADGDEHQKSGKKQIGEYDTDCNYCHHSCAIALPVYHTKYISTENSFSATNLLSTYQSYIPESLTKPNWRQINYSSRDGISS